MKDALGKYFPLLTLPFIAAYFMYQYESYFIIIASSIVVALFYLNDIRKEEELEDERNLEDAKWNLAREIKWNKNTDGYELITEEMASKYEFTNKVNEDEIQSILARNLLYSNCIMSQFKDNLVILNKNNMHSFSLYCIDTDPREPKDYLLVLHHKEFGFSIYYSCIEDPAFDKTLKIKITYIRPFGKAYYPLKYKYNTVKWEDYRKLKEYCNLNKDDIIDEIKSAIYYYFKLSTSYTNIEILFNLPPYDDNSSKN